MGWIKENFIPIFILVFLALGLGAVGYIKHQEQNNGYATYDASQYSVERASAKPIITPVEQPPSSQDRKQPSDWQTRDHKAQIGMFYAAVAAVILTLLGIVLVAFTLFYTKRAAEAAGKTLDIAKDTLSLGRLTAQAELQPYVYASIESAILGVVGYDEHFEIQANIDVRIENQGKTPAISLFCNFAGICSVILSKGETSKVGFSTWTEKLKLHLTKSGRSMLGAGESYVETIRMPFRLKKSTLSDPSKWPNVDGMRLSVGLRLSFTDDFIPADKKEKRYGRRVIEFEFGSDCVRNPEPETPFLRNVETKDVDYPEQHNRQDRLFPHAYYSSGVLDLIKMRRTTENHDTSPSEASD